MKTWTLSFKVVDKKNFDELKTGLKSVETRAGTVKYQPIEVGDTLVFVCNGEKLLKKVIKIDYFKSVEKMIEEIPLNKIMPSVHSIDDMKKAYSSYSGYDKKIKEFGILAFHLK